MSAGLGGTPEPTSESKRGHQRNHQINAIKECVESQREITEEPNFSSLMGLSKPEFIAYQEEIIDATNRGVIVKRLVNLISLLLVVITLALIAATFIGVPAGGLFTYARWLGELLIPLLGTAVGYYFGRAQSNRHHK